MVYYQTKKLNEQFYPYSFLESFIVETKQGIEFENQLLSGVVRRILTVDTL